MDNMFGLFIFLGVPVLIVLGLIIFLVMKDISDDQKNKDKGIMN